MINCSIPTENLQIIRWWDSGKCIDFGFNPEIWTTFAPKSTAYRKENSLTDDQWALFISFK
jgi:hypothetical protein